MKALILDDELYCTEALDVLIGKHCKAISQTIRFTEPAEAIQYLENNPVDILFLDVEMPAMTGFDVLDKLTSFKGAVIFTTAYENYAVQAFKADAIDYLLKPVDKTELLKAVEKAGRMRPGYDHSQLMAIIQKTISGQQAADKRVMLPLSEGIHMVEPDKIIRCESDGSYSHVFIQNSKTLLVSKSLRELEELFQSGRFFRLHKSHLINLDHIKLISRQDGGFVTMSDDSHVTISRSVKDEFFSFLKGNHG